MYELLTKKVPFVSNGQLSLFCRENPHGGGFPVDILKENGVGDSAVELIQLMLKPNPEERMNVQACLEHAWCQVEEFKECGEDEAKGVLETSWV